MDEPVWVFGYGSLIWRVDFDHVDVQPAWITGWQRRFWQGSVDHRGQPNAPGRVVTIVPQEDAICHGLAY
ncbi:MAG: gamma-glutamylcyclotransferase, partial [Pseudomonadales bacterium]|nr:gamma-glutamylcyclotransferase [Pseudomonadales bacterium]